ncbi:MAG: hypothetical protein Kow0031_02400 [Anaerolineae bacterium]
MSSIPEIVSYLNFGRNCLLESIEGLSRREMTEIPVYPEWTIKDVLAHIIGWDRRVIAILPLIVNDRAGEVPGVDVADHNARSVAAGRQKSLPELLAEIRQTHQEIMTMISGLEHREIDRRHERNGRVITIRSYIIQIMVDHERQHAAEIEAWRAQLDEAIDPAAIKAGLRQSRERFMARLDAVSEAQALQPNTAGEWSINDVVGHLVDWERLILQAARHIHDPSQPAVPPYPGSDDDLNQILAGRRAGTPWAETLRELRQVQQQVDAFVAGCTPGDWRLRGPYPYNHDHGTLAELVGSFAVHYDDHLPDLPG